MIIREREEDFIMVRQNDHGLLSGQLARELASPSFLEGDYREDAIFAVSQHDRGWMELDDVPFWNDAAGAPYSFVDFPLVPKLTFYTKGMDEVQRKSPYAALLCSLHYNRLVANAKEVHPVVTQYLVQEEKRRNSIIGELGISGPEHSEMVMNDLRVLQFCDDLSLYLCLNEPGVDKEHEHPWWRGGFHVTSGLDVAQGGIIQAHWKDRKNVVLEPFPFKASFQVELTYRCVSKRYISVLGLVQAFEDADVSRMTFQLQSAEAR